MYGSKLRVKRFESSILQYEAEPVVKGKILFYGHSLFTRCSFISKYGQDNPKLIDEVRMKDGSQACVNHGFGTSSADDLLYTIRAGHARTSPACWFWQPRQTMPASGTAPRKLWRSRHASSTGHRLISPGSRYIASVLPPR